MTSKRKILVLSSAGQLGEEISSQFEGSSELVRINRKDCDFNDLNRICSIVESHSPNIIINCSGFTNVNGAENEKEEAININKNLVKSLVKTSNKINSLLIHFSTDYVFDGLKNTPYAEDDLPKPINYYGLTKYEGEKILINDCNRYILFRTSWLHSEVGTNFVKTIINLIGKKNSLEVVGDQYGSPTSSRLVAKILKSMVSVDKNLCSKKLENQTYHVTTEGVTNWYDITKEIILYLQKKYNYKKEVVVHKVPSRELDMAANRPLYSKLSTLKVRQSIDFDIPSWEIDLHDTIDLIIKKNRIKF
mgnify:CR=1 FL=1